MAYGVRVDQQIAGMNGSFRPYYWCAPSSEHDLRRHSLWDMQPFEDRPWPRQPSWPGYAREPLVGQEWSPASAPVSGFSYQASEGVERRPARNRRFRQDARYHQLHPEALESLHQTQPLPECPPPPSALRMGPASCSPSSNYPILNRLRVKRTERALFCDDDAEDVPHHPHAKRRRFDSGPAESPSFQTAPYLHRTPPPKPNRAYRKARRRAQLKENALGDVTNRQDLKEASNSGEEIVCLTSDKHLEDRRTCPAAPSENPSTAGKHSSLDIPAECVVSDQGENRASSGPQQDERTENVVSPVYAESSLAEVCVSKTEGLCSEEKTDIPDESLSKEIPTSIAVFCSTKEDKTEKLPTTVVNRLPIEDCQSNSLQLLSSYENAQPHSTLVLPKKVLLQNSSLGDNIKSRISERNPPEKTHSEISYLDSQQNSQSLKSIHANPLSEENKTTDLVQTTHNVVTNLSPDTCNQIMSDSVRSVNEIETASSDPVSGSSVEGPTELLVSSPPSKLASSGVSFTSLAGKTYLDIDIDPSESEILTDVTESPPLLEDDASKIEPVEIKIGDSVQPEVLPIHTGCDVGVSSESSNSKAHIKNDPFESEISTGASESIPLIDLTEDGKAGVQPLETKVTDYVLPESLPDECSTEIGCDIGVPSELPHNVETPSEVQFLYSTPVAVNVGTPTVVHKAGRKRSAQEAEFEPLPCKRIKLPNTGLEVPLNSAIELLRSSGAALIYQTKHFLLNEREFNLGRSWVLHMPLPRFHSWTIRPYELIDLPNDSTQFLDIEMFFQHTSVGKNFRVNRITRVENMELLNRFRDKVRDVETRIGSAAVVRLFHGTPQINVRSICAGNFDYRLAGTSTAHTYFGAGVNFSPISFYASHYGDLGRIRTMFVCDVVMGKVCSVRNPKAGRPQEGYDTNIKSPIPQVLCKYDDDEFYPSYIIEYTVPPDHEGLQYDELLNDYYGYHCHEGPQFYDSNSFNKYYYPSFWNA